MKLHKRIVITIIFNKYMSMICKLAICHCNYCRNSNNTKLWAMPQQQWLQVHLLELCIRTYTQSEWIEKSWEVLSSLSVAYIQMFKSQMEYHTKVSDGHCECIMYYDLWEIFQLQFILGQCITGKTYSHTLHFDGIVVSSHLSNGLEPGLKKWILLRSRIVPYAKEQQPQHLVARQLHQSKPEEEQ